MRIISGSARGAHLANFPGGTIRPTPDRVREAIFSILTSRLGTLEGCKTLDLFAGSGAMAIEALSRGARRAWLVDNGELSARIVPANLATCRVSDRARFLRTPVDVALPQLVAERPFDLIFLDPPYGKELVPQTLAAIDALQLLAPPGLIVAEAERCDPVAEQIGKLQRSEVRFYGIVAVHLFVNQQYEG